jgi:hypothetical protein
MEEASSAEIKNNHLPWDGSHLGNFPNLITHNWVYESVIYSGLTFPDGNILYCITKCTNNKLPFIIEGIKEIFNLQRCGTHGIQMERHEYILYYVPVTTTGELIWETPLNRLTPKHAIRMYKDFRAEMQKIVMFWEIMSLTSATESSVWIRNGQENPDGERYIPMSMNLLNTTINRVRGHDCSILTKVIINKWFGEETELGDVVKDMINYYEIVGNNRSALLLTIKYQIEEIINRYDSTLIWYSYFIVDRIARYL